MLLTAELSFFEVRMGRKMSGFEFFDVSNFLLHKGGVLPLARLAYRTLGTLNAANGSGAVVVHWNGH